MLNVKPFFVLSIAAIAIHSCKKDDVKPNPDIRGTWAGTSLYQGTTPISLRFIISDYNLVTADQAPDNPQTNASGSYSFVGDSVVVRALSNFDSHIYYHKMGLNSTHNQLTGYWYDETNHANGGTLSLNKQ